MQKAVTSMTQIWVSSISSKMIYANPLLPLKVDCWPWKQKGHF